MHCLNFLSFTVQANKTAPPPGTPVNYTGKRVSLYVGNLTWVSTDSDLISVMFKSGIMPCIICLQTYCWIQNNYPRSS